MFVTRIHASNLRCFESLEISPSRSINLIVGGNNSGKSTILRTITAPQFGPEYTTLDRRLINDGANITLELSGSCVAPSFTGTYASCSVASIDRAWQVTRDGSGSGVSFPIFYSDFPNNFACVFLAKRKVSGYSEGMVTAQHANRVMINLENLVAKLDRILADGSPARADFIAFTSAMLGLQIGVAPSVNGRSAGYMIDMERRIEISSMGEGVAQILALTADLLRARDKVFVIEELENDLHPKAIRALLDLVIDSARERGNQFFISTHSNVVLRHLASESGTKVFRTSLHIENRLPTADADEVPNTPEARRELLEELGYELFDAGLYEGYLLLEESSAETIINEFLIPNFAPSLQRRLRTMAAQGFNEAEARFNDFVRLFTFLHLEPTYRDRAWVVFDEGVEESKAVARMKAAFVGPDKWSEQTFRQWSKHDFERFYPLRFAPEVDRVLGIESKKEKDLAKKALRSEVMDWARAEPVAAKEAFQESATEVIDLLREIESELSAAK